MLSYKFIPPIVKLALLFGSVIPAILATSCSQSRSIQDATPTLSQRLPIQKVEGFERAYQPIPLKFPADHGAHPGYLTEWWYYTGNLDTPGGQHFGYQLTFFRRALIPPTEHTNRSSAWATDQIYLAHFALTDVSANKFHAYERFARGAAGLAGATSPPFRVWLHDWKVEQTAENDYQLHASEESLTLDLYLRDIKGPILNGNAGYSQKGNQPGNASIYISQTRLETNGKIQINQDKYDVAGLSWMDHEFSTSALSEDQVGWDWFAFQLDNGSEIMLFYLRKQDGSIDPFSSGTYITPDGTPLHLTLNDFSIEVLDTWRSPHSKAEYPSRWRVQVPSMNIDLEVNPYIPDQELNLTFTYWEGAVKIQGVQNGAPILGNGYVELTGYSGAFAGDF
jgi:predicted secreted hydrolase